jgi:hypothetical protein
MTGAAAGSFAEGSLDLLDLTDPYSSRIYPGLHMKTGKLAQLLSPAWLAGAALAGCGGGGSGPSVSLTGAWPFTVSSSNTTLQTSCQTAGTVNLTQTGSSFSGTATATTTCTGPGGVSQSSGNGTIGGGQITGSAISFTDNTGCSYTGTVSGDPSNRMSGVVTCSVPVGGQTYVFSGTWQASR